MKERVTVVETATDDGTCHCLCSIGRQIVADLSQSSDVMVTRSANCMDLRIKRQVRVNLYDEQADVISGAPATATVPALMVVRRSVAVPTAMTSDLVGLSRRSLMRN